MGILDSWTDTQGAKGMRVGLVTGKESVELKEFPKPEALPHCAVVDISYCGICGTDLHAYLSGDPYNPAICGHEWVGTVSAAHNTVDSVKEGDRVAVGAPSACGACATCRRGDATHCETAFAVMCGVDPLAASHGGFAPQICVAAERIYQVDSRLSDEQAGILEPVTIAVHATRRTQINLGDTVVVIGGGPIGLLVLQCARAAGAGTVVLFEPQPERQAIARTLGADLVLDPMAADAQEALAKHLGTDAGADVVFECAGIPQTINKASHARRGGVVSLVGFATVLAEITPAEWLIKEVRLSSSIAALREDFYIAQGLVADGRVQTDPLHTATIGLDDMAGAFAGLAREPTQVKVLVDPRI